MAKLNMIKSKVHNNIVPIQINKLFTKAESVH